MGAYIAEVRVSSAVAAKLRSKHDITEREAREALVLTRLEREEWEQDDAGRWRLLATGTAADGRRVNAVLYPADERDGTWWLATALWRRRTGREGAQ